MNKSTKKIIIWECVVGGGIFLLLLILAVVDVFSFIYLFVGVIVIIILGSVVMTIVIVLKKKALIGKEDETEEVYIKTEEAKLIAKEKLYDKDIMEYEKELIYEKIGHFGTLGNEIPVYTRKILGLFENNTLAVLVNMKDKKSSFKFYDDTKISQEEIDRDLEKESNLLVKSPAPLPKMKVTEESSPLTGITKTTKEPIEKETEKKEEGGLE